MTSALISTFNPSNTKRIARGFLTADRFAYAASDSSRHRYAAWASDYVVKAFDLAAMNAAFKAVYSGLL